MSDSNVLIIGGGISGRATAWWLAEGGAQAEHVRSIKSQLTQPPGIRLAGNYLVGVSV